jgi:hypothetical protein
MTLPLQGLRLAWAVALSALAFAALAADPATPPGAHERYEVERARCLSGQTKQDVDVCLREAAAALQTARQGRPEDPASDLEQNRYRRCDVHPGAEDREECIRRMKFGVTTGSVEGGAVVRELRTLQTQ